MSGRVGFVVMGSGFTYRRENNPFFANGVLPQAIDPFFIVHR
jgi:hypothetical protein